FIYFGFSEPSKEMLLSKAKRNFTIMDIGANVGEISHRLALDKSSEIYSFEPDPVNFDRFTRNLDLNDFENIMPFRLGLGSHPENAILCTETINNRAR